MTVAVGFSLRRIKIENRIAERRLNAALAHGGPSTVALRRDSHVTFRGLKPTATIAASLREECVHRETASGRT